jgi:ABC-type multidrug transport system ATPase subunit
VKTEGSPELDGAFDAEVSLHTVSLQRATVVHGDLHALFRASATLGRGQVVGILGGNGAGKSTLLNLLSTLSAPTEGSVVFNERLHSVRHRLRIRPHIGLVSHESMIHGELSGRENLEYTAALYGQPSQAAREWLVRVGLDEAADRRAADYSRGMRQRLSIARALISAPSLVLFDEPLTGLDRSGQAFFWSVVSALKAAGRMVAIVTHDFNLPEQLVDRLWVLDRGRIRYDGPIEGSVVETWNRALHPVVAENRP